jgi:hypothetical protein
MVGLEHVEMKSYIARTLEMLFRCFQTCPTMQKKIILLGMHITGYVYSAPYFCKQQRTMQKEAIGSGKGGGGGEKE